MKPYLDAAENAARAAGKLLRENFQQRQRVKTFAAHDIKLEIDVRAQELIRKLLLEEFTELALYGEKRNAAKNFYMAVEHDQKTFLSSFVQFHQHHIQMPIS